MASDFCMAISCLASLHALPCVSSIQVKAAEIKHRELRIVNVGPKPVPSIISWITDMNTADRRQRTMLKEA